MSFYAACLVKSRFAFSAGPKGQSFPNEKLQPQPSGCTLWNHSAAPRCAWHGGGGGGAERRRRRRRRLNVASAEGELVNASRGQPELGPTVPLAPPRWPRRGRSLGEGRGLPGAECPTAQGGPGPGRVTDRYSRSRQPASTRPPPGHGNCPAMRASQPGYLLLRRARRMF